MTNQIQRDAKAQIMRKLHNWVKDGHQLCELVDLNADETMILILLKVTITTLVRAYELRTSEGKTPKSEFMKMMNVAYDCAINDLVGVGELKKEGRRQGRRPRNPNLSGE